MADQQDQQAQDPTPVVFPTNPERMALAPQERQLALGIKAAVQADPELESLSDFMYVHYAIVSLVVNETDMEKVLDKIRGLQHFKQEYCILDTCSNGQQAFSRLILDVTPGTFLCFGFSPLDNSYYNVRTVNSFDSSIANEERTHLWMAGEYYMKHAAYPDFEAIRRGLTTLVECEGYEWKNANMFNIKFIRKLSAEFARHYPMNYKSFKFYNTGVFVNLAVASMRKFVPTEVSKRFEVGCKFEPGRFHDVFMVPTPEAANLRLVQQFSKALEIRYRHEASFSLGSDNDVVL